MSEAVRDVDCLGSRLRVTAWPGSGPAVVGLHGFTGVGSDFTPLAARLGLPFWAPDLPGHGESEAPRAPAPYRFAEQARRLAALPAALGLERPVLFGYSFGGRLALRMLVDAPQAWTGAVLVGATAGIEEAAERDARAQADAALASDLESRGVEPFLAEWVRRPIIASQAAIAAEDRQRMAAGRRRHTRHGLAHALREAGTGRMAPLWDRLAEVRSPVLLISGERDPKFTDLAQRLAAALPDANRTVIPEAGHCAHLERPETTAAQVRAFIEGLSR